MIAAENLAKTFTKFGQRPVIALNGATFECRSGETLGIIGPNGAGKTTLLRILATLLPASSGRATVAGHDVNSEPDAVRENIGFVSPSHGQEPENNASRTSSWPSARPLPRRDHRQANMNASPTPAAVKPHYHSRLGIIVAKELGDMVLAQRPFPTNLLIALLFVPVTLALSQLASIGHGHVSFPMQAIFANSDLRDFFPNILWLSSMFLITTMSAVQMEIMRTLEPLLATCTRRSEIITGKLLAFGILMFCFSLIQVAMLIIAAYTPAVYAWYPFLSYFHPSAAFFAELILVLTFGGCAACAFFLYVRIRPITSDARSAAGNNVCTFGIFVVIELASAHYPALWPLLGFTPLLNINKALSQVFSQLPMDPRVLNPPPFFGAVWDHQYFWLVVVIGSAVTTLVFAALILRNLQVGERHSNNAK